MFYDTILSDAEVFLAGNIGHIVVSIHGYHRLQDLNSSRRKTALLPV